MKTKTFDCVEMKRRAALRIYEETREMTPEEKMTYWQRKNEEFLHIQEQRRAARGTKGQ